MSNDRRALLETLSRDLDHNPEEEQIRDIHALTTPPQPHTPTWESSTSLNIHRSSNFSSIASDQGVSSENFTTMSREFNAMVLAGSAVGTNGSERGGAIMGRIGEEEGMVEETNSLAIVPDYNPPMSSPGRGGGGGGGGGVSGNGGEREISVERVKKEEANSKINAWENAKIAKINNRFKRQDAIISAWESEEVQKANSWMNKVERKLEEKRIRALEKMQNDIAKAHRKAEESRATAEAKRGTKAAKILEIANFMRAVGKAPVKRSFF